MLSYYMNLLIFCFSPSIVCCENVLIASRELQHISFICTKYLLEHYTTAIIYLTI